MPATVSTETAPARPNGAPEGCWFDEAAATAACDFFPRYLRHTEGKWAGRPFHLAPWERDIVRSIFGWKRADGLRLIRVVYIEVPRKNGKSEFAAGLALLMMLGDAEFGAQVYAMAVDKDQAKIVFNKAATMVAFSETLGRLIESLKTALYCPELRASFKPLSSSPAGKAGFSATGIIGDELHEWRNGDMQDVVHKGMAAREQPLEIYITTAGVYGVGFGWEMHDYAVKVLAGELVDPEFYATIFAANDSDDWTDPAVWAKANPNLDVSVQRDFIEKECRKAKGSARLENNFKRFHLNLWTEQVVRWLAMDAWDECAGPVAWREMEASLAGRQCFSGVDLSKKTDLTALVHFFPPAGKGERWAVLPRFFLPKDTMSARAKGDRLPYELWSQQGALMLTEGNVVDYNFVQHQLAEDAKRFQIKQCGFDPWNAMQFATNMQNEGMTMVECRQGFGSMSAPAKEFEALVVGRTLHHGGHPLLRDHAKNIAVSMDPAGNIKPDKKESNQHIDGVVAAIIALRLAGGALEDPARIISLPDGYEVAVA